MLILNYRIQNTEHTELQNIPNSKLILNLVYKIE